MGIMVYSLLWVMQDLYHQPYGMVYCIRAPNLEGYSKIVSLSCDAQSALTFLE